MKLYFPPTKKRPTYGHVNIKLDCPPQEPLWQSVLAGIAMIGLVVSISCLGWLITYIL